MHKVSGDCSLPAFPALACRLLGAAVAQRLRRVLHGGGGQSPFRSAALGGLVSVADGLAGDVLRYRLPAPPALAALQQLLSVLAAAAGGSHTPLSEVGIADET